MPDFRAFCPTASAATTEITLSRAESHHLVTVNRARRGDLVTAFDGRGTEWITELATDRNHAAVLRVRSTRKMPPLPYRITLAQALPKGSSMDAIIRKATEIGATRIIPVETERTQVHLDGDRSDRKIEKWRVAALEAAKQCGNPFVPEISPVADVSDLITAADNYDLKLIASLQPGARSLKTVLSEFRAAQGHMPRNALWLVGPEGDFTAAEFSLAEKAGFSPVTLGPLVLRCETAATYALSILSYELQNAATGAGLPSE